MMVKLLPCTHLGNSCSDARRDAPVCCTINITPNLVIVQFKYFVCILILLHGLVFYSTCVFVFVFVYDVNVITQDGVVWRAIEASIVKCNMIIRISLVWLITF